MATELRPLDFGDRLGTVFKAYASNFVALVAIVAVVIIPVQLLAFMVGRAISRDLPVDDRGFVDFEAIDGGDVASFATSLIVLAVIAAIGGLLATAGVTKAVADATIGQQPRWQDSLLYGVSKIGHLIVGSILFALGLAGVALVGVLVIVAVTVAIDTFGVVLAVFGAFALFAVLIALAVSWSIWVPAVIVEDKNGFEALGRSNELIGGRRWPVSGYLLVVFIIVSLIDTILSGILGAIVSDPASPAQLVIDIVIAVLTTPITAAALVVLYFDQRVRNEGFGAGDLAADMGTTDHDIFGSLPPEPPQAPEEPDDDIPEGFGG